MIKICLVDSDGDSAVGVKRAMDEYFCKFFRQVRGRYYGLQDADIAAGLA